MSILTKEELDGVQDNIWTVVMDEANSYAWEYLAAKYGPNDTEDRTDEQFAISQEIIEAMKK
jgi:hypothetical protein